jgi:hypothetical protein
MLGADVPSFAAPEVALRLSSGAGLPPKFGSMGAWFAQQDGLYQERFDASLRYSQGQQVGRQRRLHHPRLLHHTLLLN